KLPGPSDGECVSANGGIGRAIAPVEIDLGIVANDAQRGEIHVVVVLTAQTIADGGGAGVDAKPVDVALAARVGILIEDKAQGVSAAGEGAEVGIQRGPVLPAPGVGDGNRPAGVLAVDFIVEDAAGECRCEPGVDGV